MQDGERRHEVEGLPVLRRDAAGIDLGSERHWVCAATPDGAAREVADFGATTPELVRMAQWLRERNVTTVAMGSTGVYWIAPHEVLEGEGFGVLLVETRQLAQVPGRNKKTDPVDCEWIQRLHSCGLLRGSFRPEEQVCMLRTLVRDKANLVAEAGDWLRRMQKSLDQMNVRCIGRWQISTVRPVWRFCEPSWQESGMPSNWRSFAMHAVKRARKKSPNN